MLQPISQAKAWTFCSAFSHQSAQITPSNSSLDAVLVRWLISGCCHKEQPKHFQANVIKSQTS
ncbi:unnamed protein product [Brassica oleracea var. botrytis]